MPKRNKNKGAKSACMQKIHGSQNFLTSRRLLERIVRKTTINERDIVVEIGTGKGHLTEVLCRKAGFVYSVEIDRRLYERATERLKNVRNVKLIQGDFMKYQMSMEGNYKVFANIPFYLTTEIVRKLTQAFHPPSDIWLVMEKGAAFDERWYPALCSGEKIYEHRKKFCNEEVRAFLYLGQSRQQIVAKIGLASRENLEDWLLQYDDGEDALKRIQDFMKRNKFTMKVLWFKEIELISIVGMQVRFPELYIQISFYFLDKKPSVLQHLDNNKKYTGYQFENGFSDTSKSNICIMQILRMLLSRNATYCFFDKLLLLIIRCLKSGPNIKY